MTKFENKKTDIVLGEEEVYYADLVLACSEYIPKGFEKEGWSKSLQKESFRVEDSMKNLKKGKTVEIEDNDIILIKKFCVGFGWATKHRDIVKFEEYIESL